MPPTKKLFIGGILLLGGFVCVASAVRIVMMDQLVKSQDFTWAMSKVFIWSCCEPFIGIVCACLPTYAPLVRKWWSASHPRRGNPYNNNGEHPPVFVSDKPSRRGDWMHGLGETTLRGEDDEIELTGAGGREITVKGQGGDSEESLKYQGNKIIVRRDFSWARSQRSEQGSSAEKQNCTIMLRNPSIH
ncbi:hypothetical protein VTI74DRAFT_5832 [Chaetomium olivicolor]